MEKTIRIVIDRRTCIAAGECVAAAPHIFVIDAERIAALLNPESRVDNDPENVAVGVFLDEDAIWDAAESCPVNAIALEDPETDERLYP